MDAQTALRFMAVLLEFIKRDNTLSYLVAALDAMEQHQRTLGHEAQAIQAWHDADALGETERNIDALIEWVQQQHELLDREQPEGDK